MDKRSLVGRLWTTQSAKSLDLANRGLRVAWLLLLLISIILIVISWSVVVQRHSGACTSLTCQQAREFQEDTVARFQDAGLSLTGALAAQIGLEALAMLPYFAVAIVLFARQGVGGTAFLAAFVLPAFAVIALGPASMLISVPNAIGFLARLLYIIGQSSILIFFLVFPDGRFYPRWTRWVAAIWTAMFVIAVPFGHNPVEYIGLGFLVFLLIMVGAQIYRYRTASSPMVKQQTKWVVIGFAFSIGGFSLLVTAASLVPAGWVEAQSALGLILVDFLFYFFLAAIPVFIGIAILRNRLWDIEVVINRALIYGPLSVVLAGLFAVSVALINQSAREFFGTEATTTAAVVSAVFIATIFQPLRARIESAVNKRFYPDNFHMHKEFVEFSPEVRAVIGTDELLDVVAGKLAALLKVQHVAILLPEGKAYRRVKAFPTSTSGAKGYRPTAAELALLRKGLSVSKGQAQGLWVPAYLQRMHAHDVVAVLDIGPRKNKLGFSSDDKKSLNALGADIGLSIYTAQLREKTH